ncbi:Yip1 domain protein [Terriglobus roseus DSM 18391]|uniref:Yip1 domain protein n=2 Tax=Terriglobus roseus TaxID=392734 RepID=I3ZC06_TERRK|nr:Yip1 domain protein [Terriglobus roseus DSM 18391]
MAGPRDAYDDQPALTEVQRVTNTFVAPTKTFADLRRSQSWWLPFLLVVLFSYLFSGAAVTKIGLPALAASAIHTNPKQEQRYQESTPEQRAQIMTGTRVVMGVVLSSFLLTVPLYCAIFALLLWVGFNFVLGGSGTFKGMFAVTMFASLPGILRSLLIVGLMYAGGSENFNINDPIGTNPGFFLGADSSAFLKSALSSVDIFTLWSLALMAIGAAIVARVKVKNGVAMVFGVWLVFVLLKSAVTAMMA